MPYVASLVFHSIGLLYFFRGIWMIQPDGHRGNNRAARARISARVSVRRDYTRQTSRSSEKRRRFSLRIMTSPSVVLYATRMMPFDIGTAGAAGAAPALKYSSSILHRFAVSTQNWGIDPLPVIRSVPAPGDSPHSLSKSPALPPSRSHGSSSPRPSMHHFHKRIQRHIFPRPTPHLRISLYNHGAWKIPGNATAPLPSYRLR